jgi:hypothetical protein
MRSVTWRLGNLAQRFVDGRAGPCGGDDHRADGKAGVLGSAQAHE